MQGNDSVVKNLYIYGAGTGMTSNNGIKISAQTNCEISGCIIENCGIDGINIFISGTKNRIVNNIIKSNFRHGLRCKQVDGLFIEGNNILSNTSDGILMENTFNSHCGRNRVFDNSGYAIHLRSPAPFFPSNNNLIEFNITKEGSTIGTILIAADCENNTIISNTATIIDNGINTQIGHNVTV